MGGIADAMIIVTKESALSTVNPASTARDGFKVFLRLLIILTLLTPVIPAPIQFRP
jgi:hypothetical protein